MLDCPYCKSQDTLVGFSEFGRTHITKHICSDCDNQFEAHWKPSDGGIREGYIQTIIDQGFSHTETKYAEIVKGKPKVLMVTYQDDDHEHYSQFTFLLDRIIKSNTLNFLRE